MRVQFDLDGETANGELRSSPDAIGVCTVRVLGQDLRRHVNRLTALDPLAAAVAQFLAPPRCARPRVRGLVRRSDRQLPTPRDWTIDDVEALRAYATAAYIEAARGKQTRARQRRCDQLRIAGAVIKLWLKQSRMGQVVREAKLTEAEARDPICLLQAASRTIIVLTKRCRAAGQDVSLDERRLVSVIRDYLNHHAPPGSVPASADEDEDEPEEPPVQAQESTGEVNGAGFRYQREDRRW